MIYYLLISFWFIRQIKAILFGIYLWQLKEYHLGRFIDHFRTEKGKRIFLNTFFFLKILLLLAFFTTRPGGVVVYFLLFLYFFESIKAFKDFFQKKLKKPVLTKKTVILTSAALVLEFLFLFILFQTTEVSPWFSWRFPFWLLVFDILTLVIISAVVLFFQPLTVLIRGQVIRKAKLKRQKFKNLLVIGITGSYGKTSTKEFLAQILKEKFKVLKTKEHQNSEVGISQCILNELNKGHEIFIVEMGAYNRGGIKLLCDIAKPKIGILTGINEQHMALFGSQENIIRTKFELIEALPDDGTAFFNGKNKYCLELYQKTKIKKYLYGQEATFPGRENILGAIVVAKELGMSEEEISRASQKIENKFPGIELKKGINGLNIIDATYSANPNGVAFHLDYLKTLPNKKIIVMPCLIELGSASKEVHQRIGKKIAEVCDLAIITTKERFKEIKKGAIKRGMKSENILFMEDPKEILERIQNFCSPNDVVLLESRVPKKLIDELISK